MKTGVKLDLFCRVIDNFGDAGVCWRLARQLAAEWRCRVRLWIDKPSALHRICPEVGPFAESQVVSGVEVRLWPASFPFLMQEAMPDVVIEGFGARLPESYVRQMAAGESVPVWINLEYLSAEAWVEESHRMASPQSQVALTKYFYFPGFTPRTGGLIRERGLLSARRAFQADKKNTTDFLAHLGVKASRDDLLVSLFCYPDAPVVSLLECFRDNKRPVVCLMPEGVASEAVRSFIEQEARAGTRFSSGRLTLHILPMIKQDDYDRLLWSCDLNFIRGEDSFVRAQWAARPFVWHIYSQEENAHRMKLDAFLEKYRIGLPPLEAEIVTRFWHVWNGQPYEQTLKKEWGALEETLPILRHYGQAWAEKLTLQPDLAAGLLRFISTLR